MCCNDRHCILCFFFFPPGGSLPHEESSLVVNKGEELRLRCNEDGPVTWNFQNSDPSAKARSSNEKEWYTKNATVRDVGRYVCKSKGNIVTSFYVFVKGKYQRKHYFCFPAPQSFSHSQNNRTVNAGGADGYEVERENTA